MKGFSVRIQKAQWIVEGMTSKTRETRETQGESWIMTLAEKVGNKS